MKSYNNLFPEIVSFQNLLKASEKARKGKRAKHSCAEFELNLENELVQLHSELLNRQYQHGEYRKFVVYDPKQRIISASPYRDRVVHHALCNVIEPLLERSFIYDSYACRRGKGVHKAVDRYTYYARRNKYVLKCDIRKYFHAIDHQILQNILFRKIRCPGARWLISHIIDSHRDTSFTQYFPGDTLLTPVERRSGIPIGNLTSQFFANVYLDSFDHFVKEELSLPYIRYVDDFVAFSNSKKELDEVKKEMVGYLAGLRLCLHTKKSRIHRVAEGVRFLGFRVFPEHRLLDKANVLRMRRKMKTMSRNYSRGMVSLTSVHQSIQSWVGHAGHADTWKLRSRVLGSVTFQRGNSYAAAGRELEQ